MIKSSLKAIVGGAIAGLTYLVPVSGDGISLPESLATVLAFLVGFNGVYWVKNR
jgi:hypothetical protein